MRPREPDKSKSTRHDVEIDHTTVRVFIANNPNPDLADQFADTSIGLHVDLAE